MRWLGGIALVALLQVFISSGCNSGSRNKFDGTAPPVIDPTAPRLTIQVLSGQGGDVIALNGFNFSSVLTDNVVTFSDNAGTIQLEGDVLSFTSFNFDPNFGLETRLTVVVPTAARTGLVSLKVDGIDAGATSFEGAPVIVGFALGDDGVLPGAVVDGAGTVTVPDAGFTLYGYNLSGVTNVIAVDGNGTSFPNLATSPGIPVTATYSLPDGMDAITVAWPQFGPNSCDTMQVSITVEAASGGIPLAGNSIQIPLRLLFGPGQAAELPATITGVLVSSGTRAGAVDVYFNMMQDPTTHRWDVLPEYLDPGTGQFEPCTPAGNETGLLLLPGAPNAGSQAAGIIGGGAWNRFAWDTVADLGAVVGTDGQTVLRLKPVLVPSTPLLCSDETTEFFTGPIGIDNTLPPNGAIVENFETNDNEGGGDAFWNPGGSGQLVGSPVPQDPAWGTGQDDVTLLAGESYTFFTDTGDAVDSNSQTIFTTGNPGQSIQEFHFKTLTIQDGAIVQVQGTKPLIIRCSGTNAGSVAFSFSGNLNLNGQDGLDGTDAEGGAGGPGGPGGGVGGVGGTIEVDPAGNNGQGEVVSVTAAGTGGNGGGGGGQEVTFAKTGISTPKGGPGGGGGCLTVGESGQILFNPDLTEQARSGVGGPIRHDRGVRSGRGGTGGGGGGASLLRTGTPQNPFEAQNGGGGGGGGGALEVLVNGISEIFGTVTANGGDGGVASNPASAGGGGGGSGGTIVFRGSGEVRIGDSAVLQAKGGTGPTGASGNLIAGDGADGRIVLESNVATAFPGQGDFSNVSPPAIPDVTFGISAGPIETGDGSLGNALDLTGETGTVVVDTDTGVITYSGGGTLDTGVTDGVFNVVDFIVPAAVNLVATGANSFLVQATGFADVEGTIDVSGADGGIPPDDVTPGLGGAPGAGGGAGGDGGFLGGGPAGQKGGMPAGLPDDLIADTPPFGGGGTPPGPLPPGMTTPALGGETILNAALPDVAGGGGGGGYGVAGLDGNTSDPSGEDGQGGATFGSIFFQNPQDGSDLLVGGGGGAGGGGKDGTPGTGGAGAGGFFGLSVQGALTIRQNAVILANGGDAFRAPVGGGNGGAGAGGGVRIQGASFVLLDGTGSDGPTIQALGGAANQTPVGASYTPNNETTGGGNGGAGRIRIETPLGFVQAGSTNIDPQPFFGSFLEADRIVSTAESLPYTVLVSGFGVRGTRPIFSSADILILSGNAVVFFDGAPESLDVPGTPGEFTGGVSDPSKLPANTEFVRIRAQLFSEMGAPAVIDEIILPYDF